MKIQNVFLCAGLALLLAGCGDYVGKENTHPLYVKAGQCKAASNYNDAAKYFEEFLYTCPRSAAAHYELAQLYGDNLDNQVLAIAHYEKFLELAPDSADSGDVKKYIEGSKKKLFEKMSAEYQAADADKNKGELEKNRQLLQQYVDYSNKLKAQNDEMRQMITSGKLVRPAASGAASQSAARAASAEGARPAAAARSAARTSRPAAARSGAAAEKTSAAKQPAAKAAAASEPAAKPGKSGTYTVKAGDTLYKIAREVYGSTRYTSLIRDANKNKLRNDRVEVGDILVIPQLPSRGGR